MRFHGADLRFCFLDLMRGQVALNCGLLGLKSRNNRLTAITDSLPPFSVLGIQKQTGMSSLVVPPAHWLMLSLIGSSMMVMISTSDLLIRKRGISISDVYSLARKLKKQPGIRFPFDRLSGFHPSSHLVSTHRIIQNDLSELKRKGKP